MGERQYLTVSLWVPAVVVVTLLVLFLLLLRNRARQGIIGRAGPDVGRRRFTSRIIADIDAQIKHFPLVLVLTAAIVGAAAWATLFWLGGRHAAVWGILAGGVQLDGLFRPASSYPVVFWSSVSSRAEIWPRRCYCRASPFSSHRSRDGS